MILLTKFVKGIVALLIVIIGVSFVAAGLWYFVSGVLLTREFNLLQAWRTAYFLLAIPAVIYDVYWLIRRALLVWYISNKLKISTHIIQEALIIYRLQEDKEPKEWTKEWVEQQMQIKRMAEQFAEAMVGHMKKSGWFR